MKKSLLIIARMGIFLTAIGVATPAEARNYVKFTCLSEARNFIIQAIQIDDEIAFEKSSDDWVNKIVYEAKKQQVYPLENGTEFSCAFSDHKEDAQYKFEIIHDPNGPIISKKKNIGPLLARLWYGDKLLLSVEANGSESKIDSSVDINQKALVISQIKIDRLDDLNLIVQNWHSPASNIYFLNNSPSVTWPLETKTILDQVNGGTK